jgi:hypothetical protein
MPQFSPSRLLWKFDDAYNDVIPRIYSGITDSHEKRQRLTLPSSLSRTSNSTTARTNTQHPELYSGVLNLAQQLEPSHSPPFRHKFRAPLSTPISTCRNTSPTTPDVYRRLVNGSLKTSRGPFSLSRAHHLRLPFESAAQQKRWQVDPSSRRHTWLPQHERLRTAAHDSDPRSREAALVAALPVPRATILWSLR